MGKVFSLTVGRTLLLLPLLTCVVVGCLTSCSVVWRLRPVKTELPVILFDKYTLQMAGGTMGDTSQNHVLYIEVNLKSKITDTTNYDTIPIFLLDSICLEGICLDSEYCASPKYYADSRKADDERFAFKPPRAYDLWFDGNQLRVAGFSFPDRLNISVNCRDEGVAVITFARLIDRVTGDLIATEAKRVQFRLKRGKVWLD